MGAYTRSREEIEQIRAAAQLVALTLREVGRTVRPGITTIELDRVAESFIRDHGGRPAFKGYRGFPNSICPSVNEEVVHGIPGARELRDGDIIGVDVGVEMNGFYGDAALTLGVGSVSAEAERLLKVTRESLMLGIAQARPGNRVGDISNAVQSHVEAQGYTVVRALVGHGIGREMHEEPAVPNFGPPGGTPADDRPCAGHRADGQRRRTGCDHKVRRLDGGDEGRDAERPLRTHRRGRSGWSRDPLGTDGT